MERIKAALKNLRILMMAENAANIFIFALALCFAADLGIIFISKLFYINKIFRLIMFVHLAGFVASFFVFIILLPKTKAVVLKADSLGFKERFITAFELSAKAEQTEIQKLAIEDAISTAEKSNFIKIYKFNINKNAAVFGIFLLILSFMLYFVPSPFLADLERQRKAFIKTEQAAEKIGEAKDMINAENLYNYEDKKNLLKKLEKEIKFERNEKSVSEKIKNSEIEFKKTADSESKDIKALAEIFKENESLESIGYALENNDVRQAEIGVDNLNRNLDNLSLKDAEAIGDALKKAEKSLDSNENEELKKVLNNCSEEMSAISNGKTDLSKAENLNNALKEELTDTIKKNILNEEENLKISKVLTETRENFEKTMDNTSQSNAGSGHIENNGSDKNEKLNKNETAKKIDSVEGNQNYEAEIKKVYVEADKNDEISYKNKVSEYKSAALKNIEDYNLSNEDKQVVKEYFSDLR